MQKQPGTRFNAYDDLFSIRKREEEDLQSLIVSSLLLKDDLDKITVQNVFVREDNQRRRCQDESLLESRQDFWALTMPLGAEGD